MNNNKTLNKPALLQKMLPFWDKLESRQKNLLIENATPIHYERHTSIHRGDFDCIGVLLIMSGSLRIYILSEDGREVTLYRLGKNDVCMLSASCILNDITFEVFIDTEQDTEVLKIDSNVYQKICNNNIYAENATYKLTISNFSDIMWAMQNILFSSFDKRLAHFLLDEQKRNNSSTIELTHEQIAKYVGSAREVVSRMLKQFENDGLVQLFRGGVKILDTVGLDMLL